MTFLAEIWRPHDLQAGAIACWRSLIAAEPAYASPFFTPEFTCAVAQVRADARVAVFREDGRIIGFWPFHARPFGYARPIGAPACDWHGPILAADCRFDPAAALAALGLSGARLPGLADPQGRFQSFRPTVDQAYIVDLAAGWPAYAAAAQDANPRHAKNMRRCRRKAEAELGPLRLRRAAGAADPAVACLFAWKRAQYHATGRHDVLAAPWLAALIRNLLDRPDTALRAELWELSFGDTPAAAELCLRAGPVLHAWFPAFDRAVGAYSPGHLLADALFEAAAADGVRLVEYGPGHGDYKEKFASRTTPILAANVHAASLAGRVRAGACAAWAGIETAAAGLAPKARRRLDMILEAEATWPRAALAIARTAFGPRSIGAH